MSEMFPNEGPLWPCGCLMGDPACRCELPPVDEDEPLGVDVVELDGAS